MLSCSIWISLPSFWMGGGLESRCVGRVYGADGAVRHHPHRTKRLARPPPVRKLGVENHLFLYTVEGWPTAGRNTKKIMY